MQDNDPADYLSRHWQTGSNEIPGRVDELIALCAADSDNAPLYRDMLLDVIRMAQADRNRWDAKIMLHTIREMEQAFSRLEMFKRRRKVTVFGSARTAPGHPLYAVARDMGAALAANDYMAITGAGGGIMTATHEGAGLDHSLGFNITLPFEQRSNTVVHGTSHDLAFGFFFLRKLFFVKEADALILCPGGFGTLDEALEVLTLVQTGKSPMVPIILLEQPGGQYWQAFTQFVRSQLADSAYIHPDDINLLTPCNSPAEAMQVVLNFYSNYHSSRRVGEQFMLRLNRPLNEQALAQLDTRFGHICVSGGFVQQGMCEQEHDEPELGTLTRLCFDFNERDRGSLRALIDFVNQPENLKTPGTA